MPRPKPKEKKMPRPKAKEKKMPRPKAKRTASSTATASTKRTASSTKRTDSDEEFLRLFVGATATEVQDEGNVEGGAEEEEEAVSIDPEDL